MIREANPQDIEAICLLSNEVNSEHHNAIPDTFEALGAINRDADFWLTYMARKDANILLIEINGQIQGMAAFSIPHHTSPPFIKNKSVCQLSTIVIASSARGQGFGKRLVEALEHYAHEKGADEVLLEVMHFNLAAIAFYRSLGYRDFSTRLVKSDIRRLSKGIEANEFTPSSFDLETSQLRLALISDRDEDGIFTLFSNSKVVEYIELEPFQDKSQASKVIQLFKTRVAKRQGMRWGIYLKDSKQASANLIGTCGFNSWNIKMKHAVIGYDLLPDYWGKGIAFEALDCIISMAFSGELPCGALNRIQADTVLDNHRSESLLLKLGFEEEGIRRQSGYWKGKAHDLKCFGRLGDRDI